MARKIEKKVISDDLLFGDDFDEAKLAKMEADLVRTPIADDLEAGKARTASADSAAEEAGFETDFDQGPLLTPSPSAEEGREASEAQKAAVARMVRSKKLLLLAVASLLVLTTAGLAAFYWLTGRQASPASSQMVRHSIVVPSYKHAASFLLFVSSFGNKKDLLRVDVQFDFSSANAYEGFKSKQVFFHDVIYQYLNKQEPPDNSFESWEKVLAKDLFRTLSHDYPETRLNAVQMMNFQRL